METSFSFVWLHFYIKMTMFFIGKKFDDDSSKWKTVRFQWILLFLKSKNHLEA